MSDVVQEPQIVPFNTGMLDVGDGHVMYFEQYGNPNGIPMVNLHGGPGSGMSESRRKLFDLDKYHLIQYDQRGCGKSTPFASLENNTTDYLVADIEKLRCHLSIDKWHVSGGSWGSSLALAYADKYADRFLSLTIDGVFLGRDKELYNLYYEGGVVSSLFTDVFDEFISLVPEEKRNNPPKAYQEMFLSNDIELRNKALIAWTKTETAVSMLEVSQEVIDEDIDDFDTVLTVALFENHYMCKNCFMDGNKILADIGEKVSHIPVHIVQGRYDMVCPFETAWEVHKAIEHSKLYIVSNAGHSAKEIGKAQKLKEVFDLL